MKELKNTSESITIGSLYLDVQLSSQSCRSVYHVCHEVAMHLKKSHFSVAMIQMTLLSWFTRLSKTRQSNDELTNEIIATM